MPSSSLTKMTVPVAAAGDPTNPSQGLLMPKLQYRFRVLFDGIGSGSGESPTELTKQVMDVTRPTISFPEITIPIYNSRIYLAGKAEWQTITISLRDDVSGKVSSLVGAQIQKQMDFVEQASAAAGIDYKFTTRIQILDGGNGETAIGILEAWELYGCFITSANYQTLNYNNNEPVTIQLTMRYDNALQTKLDEQAGPGVGIGQEVGRVVGTNVTGGAPI